MGAGTITGDESHAALTNLGGGPDFNNDGYDDLVLGDGYHDEPGAVDAGVVWVMPGSAGGPRVAHAQKWSQQTPGIPGDVGLDDYFGYVWTTGNFNGDNYDDLAVCVLGERVAGVDGAGAVVIIFGSSGGLSQTGAKLISRNTAGVPGDPTASERWCQYSLAAGDFDGNGRDDLVVASEEDGREVAQPRFGRRSR